jgi:ubiquitin-protein ligase
MDSRNTLHWTADLTGPPGTPYEDGKFKVDIAFPSTYPNAAPVLKFITKIWHPNVGEDGMICWGNATWDSRQSAGDRLLQLICGLSVPNFTHRMRAGFTLQEETNMDDMIAYRIKALEWTRLYAQR